MKKLGLVLIAVAFSVILASPTFAAPKFELPHRNTWDSDMINSDSISYTGAGVYVAVLDTGLTANWRDYFPVERIATELGRGFYEPVHYDPVTDSEVGEGYVVETSWVGSTYSTHGTHVVSTIIGYNYYAPSDAAAGFPLPPLYIEGIARGVTIIPVKVLHNYNLGSEGKFVFGTDNAVAAGINYVRSLKEAHPEWPIVISMSIGSNEPSPVEKTAIDNAIAAGVIIVAAAGNAGLKQMDWPGAYPEVISAGASGWRYEWYRPTKGPYYRLWWLQDSTYGYRDIPEPTPAGDVYVTDFSSRENQTVANMYPWAGPQELDVLAPGSWVRGPFPGDPGYSHLPWWAEGNPPPTSPVWRGNNFYYVGGTSMATPHVSAVAAMMLEKNPTLTQAQVQNIIKTTALAVPQNTWMMVFDISPAPGFYNVTWGGPEATGAGLIQADAATAAVP